MKMQPAVASLALACTLVSGCSSLNSSARVAAQQNEAALQRQQASESVVAPVNKRMHLDFIRQMQGRGLYFASLAHLDAYEQAHGPAADTQRLRADALRGTEQTAAADAAYRKLLNTAEAAAAWHGLGLLAGGAGDYAASVGAFREAAKREPTNAIMLSDLSYALLRTGDFAAARVSIAQAAELAPDNRKILGNLALFLLVSGAREKAHAVMEQARLPASLRSAVQQLADEIGAQASGIACTAGTANSCIPL
ncbi:MAG: tetratricopeptide repeat protein, partial [Noviherbaspirillum sp.]